MSEHDDAITRMRAEMDQATEGVKETAGLLASFSRRCEEGGFSRDEAMRLTAAYLTALVTTSIGGIE